MTPIVAGNLIWMEKRMHLAKIVGMLKSMWMANKVQMLQTISCPYLKETARVLVLLIMMNKSALLNMMMKQQNITLG